MERDRQAIIVDAPQLLENPLGLAAGIDEHQSGAVTLDETVHLAERMLGGMSGPRQPLGGIEHGDMGRGAAFGHHHIGEGFPLGRLRHQKTAQIVGPRHRGGQADAGERRRQPKQPRQAERQQIAALGGRQGVQLVEHDAPEAAEQIRRVGRGQDEGQLLGRGQQDIGRIAALALALGGRRIAGARLDTDRQGHLGDRLLEVARDIDGERLQGRDVESVETTVAPQAMSDGAQLAGGGRLPQPLRAAFTQIHQCWQEAGQRLAAAGRRDQQHGAPRARHGQQLELMGARLPSAARKPACERYGQHLRRRRRFENGHGQKLAPQRRPVERN